MQNPKQPDKQMLCESFETLEHISFSQCAAITSTQITGILSAFAQLCCSTVQQAFLEIAWRKLATAINENRKESIQNGRKSLKSFQGTGVLKTVLCICEAIMAEPSFSIKALLCWRRVHFLPFSASVDVGAAVCWPGAR